MIPRLIAWFEAEGSTRPAGLLRAGFAVVCWVKFGDELGFHAVDGWLGVLLGTAFFLATALLFVGLASRAAAVMTAMILGFMYFGIGWGGGYVPWTHHHIYLMVAVAVLLVFAPVGSSFSADRWLAARRGEPPPERARLTAMRLIALQVAAVYLWGAVDKTSLGWISGVRLERIFWWHYEGRALFPLLTTQPVPAILSVAVLAAEYFLAPAILFRRTQPVAVPVAIALHASFYLLLPVRVFSGLMILLYLAVVDADATERALARLAGRPGPAA